MNLPNKLTLLRIALTFVFMLCLFSEGPVFKVLAMLVFSAAALTDLLDGIIAKARNQVTDFGKIMDPIADKILVLAAFLSFIQLQLIPAWTVIVIIARELIITSLRIFAMSKGRVLAASRAGKHKTVSQMAAIFIILISLIYKETMNRHLSLGPAVEANIKSIIYLSMLSAVCLTIISGVSYMWDNRALFIGAKANAQG